jgi:hypothetical protein
LKSDVGSVWSVRVVFDEIRIVSGP